MGDSVLKIGGVNMTAESEDTEQNLKLFIYLESSRLKQLKSYNRFEDL